MLAKSDVNPIYYRVDGQPLGMTVRIEVDWPDSGTIRDRVESEIVRRCNDYDRLREENERLRTQLDEANMKLADIVVTEGEDAGVVLLDVQGTTHPETINGRTIQVYDHEYFSPLGDALIELSKILKGKD